MEPEVTLEMIEHVRAVLDDYRRCLFFLCGNSPAACGGGGVPKDVQKIVWKKAAGELEELLQRLKQKFVWNERRSSVWLNYFVALAQAERDDPGLPGDTCHNAVAALQDRGKFFGIPSTVAVPTNLGHALYVAKKLGLVPQEYQGEKKESPRQDSRKRERVPAASPPRILLDLTLE
jgi:hypothetical protein